MRGPPRQFKCDKCGYMSKTERRSKLHVCGEYPANWTNPDPSVTEKVCPICDRKCKDYGGFLRHYLSHTKFTEEPKFECAQCDKKFATPEGLSYHIEKHLLETFECDKCSFKTDSIRNWERHQGVHDVTNKLPCYICGRQISEKKMNQHIKNHSEQKNLCKICNKKFTTKEELSKHRDEDHPNNIKCDYCDKRFKTNFFYEFHKQNVHEVTKYREHRCTKCDMSYSTKQLLQHHINKTRHRSFALCCLCESMFTTKLKLQHHIETEHQLGTLKGHVYVCPICKFCMPSNQELCDHLSVLHNLTLEHPCDKCQNKVFPSELTLKIHQIEEHDYNPFKRDTNSVTDQEVIVSQKKTFQCPQCDKYLASKRVLEQHFRQVHDSANHQYKCDKCDKSFYEMSRLKKHIKQIHTTKSKEVKCDMCDKVFANKNLLQCHKRWTHSENAPICTICSKPKPNEKKLAKHMLDEHGVIYKYC